VLTAKLYTPAHVVAIDLDDARLERARALGADVTINNGGGTAVEAVMQLTDGLGADVAIEAVGAPETFELCAELVRPGGRVANVGVHGHPATLHLEKLWIRDVTDHDRPRGHVHDAAAAEADYGGAARRDPVRQPPLPDRGDDGRL